MLKVDRRPKILLLSFAFVLQLVCAGAQPAPPAPAPAPVPMPALAITGKLTVNEHQECILTLTGGTASCAWLIMPEASEYSAGQTLVFTGAPGSYSVICLAVSNGQPVILKVTAIILGSAPPPGPPPPPGPTPPPVPPAPPANPPWMALMIVDTTSQQALPAGQLAIWVSQTVAKTLLAKGVYFKRLDINNPSIATAAWKQALTGAVLPVLVVIDKSGTILSKGPLPRDEIGVTEAVTKLGADWK